MSYGGSGRDPVYRIEYAVSGRSKCNGRNPCRDTLIGLAELRYGSLVENGPNSWFAWRHFYCVTRAQINNFRTAFGPDATPRIISGFEDLTLEDQERVLTAFEVGEVNQDEIPDTARKEKSPSKSPSKPKAEIPPTPTPKRGKADKTQKKRKSEKGDRDSYDSVDDGWGDEYAAAHPEETSPSPSKPVKVKDVKPKVKAARDVKPDVDENPSGARSSRRIASKPKRRHVEESTDPEEDYSEEDVKPVIEKVVKKRKVKKEVSPDHEKVSKVVKKRKVKREATPESEGEPDLVV